VGVYKEYYPSGQLKVTGKIIHGKKNGKWNYYYLTGEIEGESIFVNNQGKYIGYYRDGIKKMTGKMDNELMVGLWELYENNGTLTGYYRPFYDEKGPVFKLEQQAKQGKMPGVWKERRLSDFRFHKKKFTPFKPNLNEFKGFIIAYNPFALLLDQFPVSIEYYAEERLGHEIQFNLIRNPFFTKDKNVALNKSFTRGYSFALKQKFYRPTTKIGSFYFAHEFRITKVEHRANIIDSGDPPLPSVIDAEELKYEYSIIFGKRFIKEMNASSFTADLFIGVGTGFRNFNQNYPNDPNYDEIFKDVKMGNVPFALRFGLNLGYIIGLGGR